MQRSDILLVIVNYNQAKEIRNFLTEVISYWPSEHMILVDDGSDDSSVAFPTELNIVCIKHPYNMGVGAAIRTGINYAKEKKYKAVLIMSSNGKMVPAEIDIVVEPLLRGEADYVTGSRFLGGIRSPGLSVFRLLSIPLFSLFAALSLRRFFSDITCGFRCYKIDFLFNGTCNIQQEWLNRYELEYYIHYFACVQKIRIKEVPVTIRYKHLEKKRTSKITPITGWWSMMRPLIFLRLGLRK